MKNIMKRRNKKGFTIVELVIVIGVIGILSAILIPTFVNVTKNAEKAALKANLANAYSSYTSEAADGYFDNYAKDSAGTQKVKIELHAQEAVCVYFENEYYHFDGEWTKASADNKGTEVVEASTKYYEKSGETYTETSKDRTAMSTFGNAVFYSYVAA